MDNLEDLKNEINRLKAKNRYIISKIDKLKREYNRRSRLEKCVDEDCSCKTLIPNESDF